MHGNCPDGCSVSSLMWFMFSSSGLKTAGGVLLLVSVTCFLALLSVNSDMIIFHYLFAGFNCVQVSRSSPSDISLKSWFLLFCPDPCLSPVVPQGPFVFFFRIVFNKEARNAMKYCCSRKRPDHMIKSKASVSKCQALWQNTTFSLTPLGCSSYTLRVFSLKTPQTHTRHIQWSQIFISVLRHLYSKTCNYLLVALF